MSLADDVPRLGVGFLRGQQIGVGRIELSLKAIQFGVVEHLPPWAACELILRSRFDERPRAAIVGRQDCFGRRIGGREIAARKDGEQCQAGYRPRAANVVAK